MSSRLLSGSLSPFDGLSFLPGHVIGVALNAKLTDLCDAGRPVRPKEETEELGHDVVELPAVLRSRELLAVGTTGKSVLDAAGSNLAPRGLLALVTSRTPVLQVRPARAAVQAAVSNQTRV
jgi:hypothetical protein